MVDHISVFFNCMALDMMSVYEYTDEVLSIFVGTAAMLYVARSDDFFFDTD